MAAAGITLIKSFSYRGESEEWSNQYHLGGTPESPEDWRAAVDDLVALEKTVYSSRVTILRALCYTNTDDNAVYTYNLADFDGTVAGTLSVGSSLGLPGDVAGWVRWDTGNLNSRGKKIYLRKYFHDVRSDGSPSLDAILPAQVTAYQAFGDAMLGTIFDGQHMVTPQGDVPAGPANVSTYATTRTLHRRGRRP